jgi:NTP pyrophosphatase (non-canonical NTP hydrolase)
MVMFDEPPHINPATYSELALRTATADETPIKALVHAALGAAGEAGELADAVKRGAFYGLPIDRTNVVEECGDLLWYVALALRAVGSSFDAAMRGNLAKLEKRYPGRVFSVDRVVNRDTAVERTAMESEGEAKGEAK